MANYLVVGLGRFGRSVAKTLYESNQDVLAIDTEEELVQQAIDDKIVGTVTTTIIASITITASNSIKVNPFLFNFFIILILLYL